MDSEEGCFLPWLVPAAMPAGHGKESVVLNVVVVVVTTLILLS